MAEVLAARADADTEFQQALATWWEQASPIRIGGKVATTVSGGTFHGPVL